MYKRISSVFSDLSNGRKHSTNKYLAMTHPCAKCDKSFLIMSMLLKHQSTHEPKPFKKNKQKKNKKVKLVKPVKRLGTTEEEKKDAELSKVKVNLNQLEVTTKALIRDIMRDYVDGLHDSEVTHECHVCEETFPDLGKFHSHLTKHHAISTLHSAGAKDKKCHICGVLFCEFVLLKKHLAKHARRGENYRCNICDKTFRTGFTLTKHLKNNH